MDDHVDISRGPMISFSNQIGRYSITAVGLILWLSSLWLLMVIIIIIIDIIKYLVNKMLIFNN